MKRLAVRYFRIALSVAGSAILLFSCERGGTEESSASEETMMTEYSEDLSVVMSQNGRRSYHFVTPLLEGYSLAREPYREFRKGVKITTYKDDSLSTVDVVLTANYAIYYENRELWEAKGNVVAEKSDGKTLYTQQLFWNAKTKKIYSNVDSKIVQNNGRDVFIGEGFESDEEFKDWRFRRMKGRMEVDAAAMQRRDSTAADSVAGPQPAAGEYRRERQQDGGRAPVADSRRGESPQTRPTQAGNPVRQDDPTNPRGKVRLQPQTGGSDRRFEPVPASDGKKPVLNPEFQPHVASRPGSAGQDEGSVPAAKTPPATELVSRTVPSPARQTEPETAPAGNAGPVEKPELTQTPENGVRIPENEPIPVAK